MPSLRRSTSLPDVALAATALSGAWAFLRAHGDWTPGLLLMAGLALVWVDARPGLRRALERLARLVIVVVAVVGIGWTLYLVVDEEQIVQWRGSLGTILLALMAVFLAGGRAWRPERGLIPVTLALLGLAAIGPGPRVTGAVAITAVFLLLWLTLEGRSEPPSPESLEDAAVVRVRRWMPLSVYALFAGLIAAGIIAALPVAQPIVEQAARRFGTGQGRAGLSESGALGAVESLGLSREVVLRMWSDGPGLLRARVHTDFDGRVWTSPPRGARYLQPLFSPMPGGSQVDVETVQGETFDTGLELVGDLHWLRIVLARAGRGWVVTPTGPAAVRLAGGAPTLDDYGVLKAPFTPAPALYALAHATLEPGVLEGEEREDALGLPETLDPRIVELARTLRGEAADDAGRVEATLAWLAGCCTYALDVGAFETDQPLAEFLFEKQRGYCEYFATAAAILLRLQGIPTRYVTGLSVQPANRRGDYYLVRGSDAHAWVDVWLEGQGWVEVDPTPAAQYAALRSEMQDGWARRAWESAAAFAMELRARLGTDWLGGLAWLLGRMSDVLVQLASRLWIGLAVIALLVMAVVVRRRAPGLSGPSMGLPSSPPDVDPALAKLLKRLEGRWAEVGHPRPPHRGHLEHAQALEEDGIRDHGIPLVTCYYRARFGGVGPGEGELSGLAAAWGDS